MLTELKVKGINRYLSGWHGRLAREITRKMRGPQSIRGELLSPIDLFLKLRLLALIEHARLKHQEIHLSAHETAITVLRRANDRLATYIETGVDDHRTAGATAKRFNDFPIPGIRFTPDSLNARRVINVSDRRNFRAGD